MKILLPVLLVLTGCCTTNPSQDVPGAAAQECVPVYKKPDCEAFNKDVKEGINNLHQLIFGCPTVDSRTSSIVEYPE